MLGSSIPGLSKKAQRGRSPQQRAPEVEAAPATLSAEHSPACYCVVDALDSAERRRRRAHHLRQGWQ